MPDEDKIDLKMFLKDYLNDAREGFQEAFNALLALEKNLSLTERLDEVFRPVHTLKSSSTMIEFIDIAEAAHITEDLLDCMKNGSAPVNKETVDVIFNAVEALEDMVRERSKGKESKIDFQPHALKMKELITPPASPSLPTGQAGPLKIRGGRGSYDPQGGEGELEPEKRRSPRLSIEKTETVKVHINLLDSLFNMVGELIITRNRIENILADIERKELKGALTDMNRIIDVLQENVSVARMVSVDEIFQKFPRMVRDLAREQNKEVDFILEGNEIELDKSLIDALSEPLIHMLRNAVDHGIEGPEERLQQNKNKAGTVKLSAIRTERHIVIGVDDDGKGIDVQELKEAAVSKGFLKMEETELMREKEALNLLFRPGFSTAKNVTEVSGRGVGLDVVMTSAKKMEGVVEITTQKGIGTHFSLKLPLTTSLIQTLMVGIGDDIFAIPSDIVLETIDIKQGEIKEIGRDRALILRGEVLPFLRLNELLNLHSPDGINDQTAIIIQTGDKFTAIGVDVVLNQMENIIKPFDPIAREFRGFSGGIIQGDGRVALLLDIPALVNLEALKEEKF